MLAHLWTRLNLWKIIAHQPKLQFCTNQYQYEHNGESFSFLYCTYVYLKGLQNLRSVGKILHSGDEKDGKKILPKADTPLPTRKDLNYRNLKVW